MNPFNFSDPLTDILFAPEPTFEEQKTTALSFAKNSFNEAWGNARVTVQIAGGEITINADDAAAANVNGLILTLPGDGAVSFRNAANGFQDASREDLEAMRLAIVHRQQELLREKWRLVEQINAAATPEDLNAIDIGGWFGRA